jgi:hypothetical protein
MRQMAEAAEAFADGARGAKLSQAGSETFRSATDPVFGIIQEHRAAYGAWASTAGHLAARSPAEPAHVAAKAAGREASARERAALDALMMARPTTLAGVLALAKYLPGAIRQVAIDEEGEGERALRTIAEAVRDLFGPKGENPAWCKNPGAAPEPSSPAPPAVAIASTRREVAALQGFTGDICPSCNGFAMRRAGTCLACQECGTTTGCS